MQDRIGAPDRIQNCPAPFKITQTLVRQNGVIIESMATIHISEAEAARDFAGLIAKVRAGAEIVIENGSLPPAILRSEFPARRTVSECIELARKHEQESG